jgi:hypothetical protein
MEGIINFLPKGKKVLKLYPNSIVNYFFLLRVTTLFGYGNKYTLLFKKTYDIPSQC